MRIDSIATLSGLEGQFKENVEITFKVIKPGCPIIPDTIKVKLKDLLLPTGFSPNGDGINDFFIIRGSQNSVSSELIIFNKWGAEVYRQRGLWQRNELWDGKNMNGNMLPEDTYFYILNYTDYDNKSHTVKGFASA
ncbi:MAG: gliding motility-associated C-terminal domain-containing protein [Ignavibacteriales bacterium]|nr:gliding motility-associated C-terminal domain-containing protein [Ignavibacteriales bacterium]